MIEGVKKISTRDGSFRCERCQARGTVSALPRTSTGLVQVRCSCGCTFMLAVEQRALLRTTTCLRGSYHRQEPPERGSIIIWDLSLGGMGFTVSDVHSLRVHDRLVVDYLVTRPDPRSVCCTVVVRRVDRQCIGAEYADGDGDVADGVRDETGGHQS